MSDSIATPINHWVHNNIFMLNEYGGSEERFTAAWGYVLGLLREYQADLLFQPK